MNANQRYVSKEVKNCEMDMLKGKDENDDDDDDDRSHKKVDEGK